MDTPRWLTVTGIVALATLALVVGFSRAQGPEPPQEQIQPQSEGAAEAVPKSIPIQGRLTDEGGTPLTGTHNVTFTLYRTPTGNTIVCQTTQSVNTEDGLFNAIIDDCTTADVDGKDLYLGIQVEGDEEMTPRRPIYPVPYAYSLVPGARISGTLTTYTPILSLVNQRGNGLNVDVSDYGVYVGHAGKDGVWVDSATDDGFYVSEAGDVGLYVGDAGNYGVYANASSTSGRGLYGRATAGSGVNYGVAGRSNSPDGYGVYGVNYDAGGVAVMADGTGIIKSVADTVVAVSPLKAVVDPDTVHPTLVPQGDGTLELAPTSTGSQYVYVPVDLPSKVFGVEQKLKGFRLCYELSDSTSYLSEVGVYWTTDTGMRTALYNDTTNRTSTSWQCYTVTDPTPAVIQHSAFIRFQLYVSNATHRISLGSIELTLTEG